MHAGVERELAGGCAVDEVVDIALHRPDMLVEARSASEAREHEAAMLADARHPREAEASLSKWARAAFRHRNGSERAVGVEVQP